MTSRFFNEATTQVIYVDPVSGSDVFGDGLSPFSPYATVPRALDDLPPDFTARVRIPLPAGTVTTAQSWNLTAIPGMRVDGFFGGVSIEGDTNSPVLAIPVVAGTLLPGKFAQYTFPVGPWGPLVTDGSHFVCLPATQSGFQFSGRAVRASVSPHLILTAGSPAAMTGATLCPWATVFSGAVRILAPIVGGVPVLNICGIRFTGAVTTFGVNDRVCRHDGGSQTLTDTPLVNCTFTAGTQTLLTSAIANRTLLQNLFASSSLYLSRGLTNMSNSVFAGVSPGQAKVMGGTAGGNLQVATLSVLNLNGGCDFEGTGNGVRMVGGTISSNDAQSAASFAISGAPLQMVHNAYASGPAGWVWTGSGGAPSTLGECSSLITNGGYQAVNSVTPGSDIVVGELPVQAVAVRPTTAPLQLCRYT